MESSPLHIGIIMDGNRRWAKAHGVSAMEGHREGLSATKKIIKAAADLKTVASISLYTFSMDNSARPSLEVTGLYALLIWHLKREMSFYRENQIRVVWSGARTGIPAKVLRALDETAQMTEQFKGMVVNLLFNYSGRNEMERAAHKWAQAGEKGSLSDFLDQPECSKLDLVIRTSGEMRVSDFALWQLAYSELFFTKTLWPDYNREEFYVMLEQYEGRDRRQGR